MELDGMHYTQLPRRLIELSGDEAAVFLQGLVSNDVSRLHKGDAVYAALLTPQGKFLHDFFLLSWQNSILIDCDRDALPDLLSRLTMYKLRSKVIIAALPENRGVAAIWGNQEPEIRNQKPEIRIFPDPRLAQMGWRAVGEIEAVKSWCSDQKAGQNSSEDYDRLRLELGVPEGARDMIREKSLLLEFGFEDLHGVDFRKGCYVGQEVTARSKYRGQVRKFIYQAHAADALPLPGTPVMLEGVPAGELRSSAGNIGLALLNVAMVEKAQAGNMNFHAEGIAFKPTLPPWVAHPPKALVAAE